MDTVMLGDKNQNRPGMVSFICWAIWLIVIPVTVLAIARLLGVPGLWDAQGVDWGLPHTAILPLSLFGLSSIGIWRLRVWGVLLYVFAGLLLMAVMILQPQVPGVIGLEDVSNHLEWLIIAALHILFSLRLWQQMVTS